MSSSMKFKLGKKLQNGKLSASNFGMELSREIKKVEIEYDIKRKIKVSSGEIQTFIFCLIEIYVFPDRAFFFLLTMD